MTAHQPAVQTDSTTRVCTADKSTNNGIQCHLSIGGIPACSRVRLAASNNANYDCGSNPKSPPYVERWEPGPVSLETTRLCVPNGVSFRSAALAQVRQTDRKTDRPHSCNNCPNSRPASTILPVMSPNSRCGRLISQSFSFH